MSQPAATRITHLLAFLDSELAAALPEHKELQDPDDLFENLDTELSRGWGVSVGGAENTERCMDGQAYYLRREFTIVLTRDIASQLSDRALRKRNRDRLLEDLTLVMKRFTGQYTVTLEGTTTVLAFDFKFVNDVGVKEIVVNDARYIFTELTVSAEYREPKT